MKLVRILPLIFLLALCLIGCETEAPEATVPNTPVATPAPTPEPTPAPTEATYDQGMIAGVDITGLTVDQAVEAITLKIPTYEFTLVANDTPISFTGEEIGMQLEEDVLRAYLTALQNEEPLPTEALATCQTSVVVEKAKAELQRGYINPSIFYDKNIGQFVILNGKKGKSVDTTNIVPAVEAAMAALHSRATVQLSSYYVLPSVADDDPRLAASRDKANRYLFDGLTYHYEAEGVSPTDVAVQKSDLASFISIGATYSVSFNYGALDSYAAKVAKTYVGQASKDAFITTGGYALPSYQVPYYRVVLDKAHLVSDIVYCMENRITGTRNAQFLPGTSAKPYDGTYVEVSIDDQHLWFYKNGKLIVSTDVITGRVSEGWLTPNGIYQINPKRQLVTLFGSDYEVNVYYWMPFISSVYGFHDAVWHNKFGGDIFIYNGSHGCVNMPYDAAQRFYNNVSVGTPVIIYGNTTSMLTQEINGTASYTVEAGSSPFTLDAAAKYTKAAISYASSDLSVATVSDDGTVTPVGTGTATITVTATRYWNVTDATFEVTVTVQANTPTPSPEDTPVPSPEDTPTPSPEDTPVPSPEDTPAPSPEGTPVPSPDNTPAPDNTEDSNEGNSNE